MLFILLNYVKYTLKDSKLDLYFKIYCFSQWGRGLSRRSTSFYLGSPGLRGRHEEGPGERPPAHQEPQNQDGRTEPGGLPR